MRDAEKNNFTRTQHSVHYVIIHEIMAIKSVSSNSDGGHKLMQEHVKKIHENK